MEEHHYFSSFDLLIRTVYAAETNSLRYATHRTVTDEERRVVERYVLTEVGPTTDYYRRTPSLLLYMGVDIGLEKEVRFHRLQGTIRDVMNQKSIVDEKVKDLINTSLSNYYFERVGDELVKLRKSMLLDDSKEELDAMIMRIAILLDAYNQQSGQNVSIEAVLPGGLLDKYHTLNVQKTRVL